MFSFSFSLSPSSTLSILLQFSLSFLLNLFLTLYTTYMCIYIALYPSFSSFSPLFFLSLAPFHSLSLSLSLPYFAATSIFKFCFRFSLSFSIFILRPSLHTFPSKSLRTHFPPSCLIPNLFSVLRPNMST